MLLCIARDPEAQLRDVAGLVGITERAAQRILADLVASAYVSRQRVGRRNSYALVPDLPLRHPLERECAVGTLLDALGTRPARQDPTPGG